MIKLYFCLCCAIIGRWVSAQPTQYLGGEPGQGIVVTSSDDHFRSNWSEIASGNKTIEGQGMDARRMEASRFLDQATLGANLPTINHLAADLDFESWIQEQSHIDPTYYLFTLENIYAIIYQNHLNEGGDPNEFRCRPRWYHANYAWWEMVLTGEDLLRQRIALALSEIIVISKQNSDLENYGYGVASFYDIFIRHAFGNYLDILMEVSLHPAMGNFLSHLNNPRSNPTEFTFPDENFGRELMQLFTIGIHELNIDGTPKLDQNGQTIPTYSNADITGISAVFTGLGAGATSDCDDVFAPAFGLDIRKIDMTVPMKMYEEWHQPGEKRIIDGHVIPAGQPGMQDVDDAITHLFNHSNVGPFLAFRLIQQMVKSNPTPAYIERVASAFNDDGQGVRGNMKSVICAILLDEEARQCTPMQDPANGKLRSPILRYVQFARSIDKFSPSGYYWNTGDDFHHATGQHPLDAPSVFNFYQPDFQPNGPLGNAGLTGPEYQLHNSISGLEFFDIVHRWTVEEELLRHRETGTNREVYIDIYNIMGGARDPEVLINTLDIMLTHGTLSHDSRKLLRRVLYEYEDEGIELLVERTMLALYFFLASADYAVFK